MISAWSECDAKMCMRDCAVKKLNTRRLQKMNVCNYLRLFRKM